MCNEMLKRKLSTQLLDQQEVKGESRRETYDEKLQIEDSKVSFLVDNKLYLLQAEPL